MKIFIFLFVLIAHFEIRGQSNNTDIFLKVISPTIVGGKNYHDQTGLFEVRKLGYELQSDNGKILPSSLEMTIEYDPRFVGLVNSFNSNTPMDIEIYHYYAGTPPLLYQTLKLRGTFNSIKPVFSDTSIDNFECKLSIFLSQFAFKYKEQLKTGEIGLPNYISGWNFLTNSPFSF